MRAMTVLAVVAVVLMAVVSLHAFQPKQQHHTVRNIPLTKRLFRVYHSDNTMAEQELLLSYAKPSLKVKLADSLLNSVFSIRPLFLKARDSARNSMIVRVSSMCFVCLNVISANIDGNDVCREVK